MEASFVQREHLEKIPPIVEFVSATLKRSGITPGVLDEYFRTGFCAECIECRIRLTGHELLMLSEDSAPDEKQTSPKVARLRQGYCARGGCDSYFYNLSFQDLPNIDWPKLLSESAVTAKLGSQDEIGKSLGLFGAQRHRLLATVAIGFAAFILLFILRQLYLGGSIPFIREPENFRVDH